jgi:hypothetical protein
MTVQTRLPFELDVRAEAAALTAHGGVPLLLEAFRASGAAAVLDEQVAIKRRRRGRTPSQLVEGLCSLWAAGGARCADLAQLRADAGLALLLGHGLPAPPTARDFLDAFAQAVPPLWQGERCQVQGEGERLQGLAKTNRRLIGFLQERRPQTAATIAIAATILESQKRSALAAYAGRTGCQPVVALWAAQDVVLADEFGAGNSLPSGRRSRTRGCRRGAAIDASSSRRWPRCRPLSTRSAGAATARSTSRRCCAGWRRAGSATRSAPPCAMSWRRRSARCRRARGRARGRTAPRAGSGRQSRTCRAPG